MLNQQLLKEKLHEQLYIYLECVLYKSLGMNC